MNELTKDAYKNLQYIKLSLNKNPELITKHIIMNKINIYVLYVESLSDKNIINDYILKYLSFDITKGIKNKMNIFDYLHELVPTHKTSKISNIDEILYNLLSGFSIILIDGFQDVLSIETKAILNSPISPAQNERTIKGPKDAFTESYQQNVGLIRKRIKDPNLKLEEFIVGKFSKSKVGVLYMTNIATPEKVKDITRRIKKINIDAIMSVSQLVEVISENKQNVFPNYFASERPDFASMNLLDGRIIIVVENTPFVAIVPAIFDDFIHNPQDYYSRSINASITRMIRFIAFILTILTPAFYVAITTFNHETIPSKLLINFSIQRDGVPFATIVEAILMILTFEILKETDARIPTSIGSSLSIVGALVLGEAAVSAGIVSPIMVIVIAITSISSLIISASEFVDGTRIWRLIFLIGSAIAGISGIVIVGFIFITFMSTTKSFGVPFLSNIAPFSKYNTGNSILLNFKNKYFRRNEYITKNRRK